MRLKLLSLLVTLGCAAMATTGAQAAGVTDQMIDNDANSTNDVLSWGLGPQGQRHSPLKSVNTSNVGKLVPVWSFSFGGEKQRGQESQPVVHNGKMFVTASYSRIFALDAKTGAKLWKYEHRLPDGIMPCCDVINRGAAIYGDKVYFATLDAQLVALNKDTGKVVWRKKMEDYQAGYSNSAAPIVVKGKVIVGNSGGEFGITGAVKAYDAETGEEVWYRPTIEGNMGRLGGKESTMTGKLNVSWPGDMWQNGGGATWLGGTYDPELNLLFFGTGNPAPWNETMRPGDNKWTMSIMGRNVDNGLAKFHRGVAFENLAPTPEPPSSLLKLAAGATAAAAAAAGYIWVRRRNQHGISQ